MTTLSNKQEATNLSDQINNDKGFKISLPTYLGESVFSFYGLKSSGWYVQNKETKKFY